MEKVKKQSRSVYLLKFGFQMAQYSNGLSMGYVLDRPFEYIKTDNIIGNLINKVLDIKPLVSLLITLYLLVWPIDDVMCQSELTTAFEYWIIWSPTSFGPFEYQTSWVFRSQLQLNYGELQITNFWCSKFTNENNMLQIKLAYPYEKM